MDFDTISLIHPNREVIDPDEPNPTGDQVSRRLQREGNKIFHEGVRLPTPQGVARLEQDSLAGTDAMWFESICADEVGLADLDYAGWSDRGIQRHLIKPLAHPDEMERSIHMRPGVRAHREP